MRGAGATTGAVIFGAHVANAFNSPANPAPDITLEIAPYRLEASPKHHIQTIAYNGQVPGPLLRMQKGKDIFVEVRNHSADPEVLHWHGLFLPSEIDGAMEEGTPMIAPGATARYRFTPDPTGFRWYHTHTFAGNNMHKGQFSGQHGFLMIDTRDNPAAYDREFFLALHDWNARMMSSDDGSMKPTYELSTINGKTLGFGEPLRVKPGERVLLHMLNSSPTEVHWLALAGHRFEVIALDGNPVSARQTVSALRLAPAERICALVTMDAPGIWILGETRDEIRKAGMGIVVEYAGATGEAKWIAVNDPKWNYAIFTTAPDADSKNSSRTETEKIPLVFDSKFEGHGSPEIWRINGKSYPKTDEPALIAGRRYRLEMENKSADDHPIHLHRHTFQLRRVGNGPEFFGPYKDVVLAPAKSVTEVEFIANHPGQTLLHCHQQDHMDRGFMMLFRYA